MRGVSDIGTVFAVSKKNERRHEVNSHFFVCMNNQVQHNGKKETAFPLKEETVSQKPIRTQHFLEK